MGLCYDIAGMQIVGAREHQEDALLITRLGETDAGIRSAPALVTIADGMGGHAAGDVASALAVRIFTQFFKSQFPSKQIPETLQSSLDQANEAIHDEISRRPTRRGMGCTLVAGLFDEDRLWWVSVGDSHLYLLRDGEFIKKNADHSYGAYLDMLAASGRQVPNDSGQYRRNMLLSALTGTTIDQVDLSLEPFTLRLGDRFILASDGLDTISAEEITQICLQSGSASECVELLLKAIEDAGVPEQDNATVIIVDVLSNRHTDQSLNAAFSTLGVDTGYGHATAELEAKEQEFAEEETRAGPRKGLYLKLLALVVLLGSGGVTYFLAKDKLSELVAELLTSSSISTAETPLVEVSPENEDVNPGAEPVNPEEPVAVTPVTDTPPEPVVVKPLRDRLKSGGHAPQMLVLPGGAFQMGSPYYVSKPDERPGHKVIVRPFAISKFEITNAEYNRFIAATGHRRPTGDSHLRKKDRPVMSVSWDDAVAYTRWLSAQTGHRYRLPTEAEWEYAAAAGTTTPYWWGRTVDKDKARCLRCEMGLPASKPAPVGNFKPNPFGLYDTAGNVVEWVQDCYHRSYDGAPEDGSAWEKKGCTKRVARGGSFRSPPPSLRTTSRDKYHPNSRLDNLGFRVVREL